jgi:hypothetical protein
MAVFKQFHSVDLLLLYPPFTSHLTINNTPTTFNDALDAWCRCHRPGIGDFTSYMVAVSCTGGNSTTPAREVAHHPCAERT